MNCLLQNSYLEIGLWKIPLQIFRHKEETSLLSFLFSFLVLWFLFIYTLSFLVSSQGPCCGSSFPEKHPVPPTGQWTPGCREGVKPVCMGPSLTQPDSKPEHNWILSKRGKAPPAFAVFLHQAGQFKYSHYHNSSRIKIAENKWQMAGRKAHCQEMGRGRRKMGDGDGFYRLEGHSRQVPVVWHLHSPLRAREHPEQNREDWLKHSEAWVAI